MNITCPGETILFYSSSAADLRVTWLRSAHVRVRIILLLCGKHNFAHSLDTHTRFTRAVSHHGVCTTGSEGKWRWEKITKLNVGQRTWDHARTKAPDDYDNIITMNPVRCATARRQSENSVRARGTAHTALLIKTVINEGRRRRRRPTAVKHVYTFILYDTRDIAFPLPPHHGHSRLTIPISFRIFVTHSRHSGRARDVAAGLCYCCYYYYYCFISEPYFGVIQRKTISHVECLYNNIYMNRNCLRTRLLSDTINAYIVDYGLGAFFTRRSSPLYTSWRDFNFGHF